MEKVRSLARRTKLELYNANHLPYRPILRGDLGYLRQGPPAAEDIHMRFLRDIKNTKWYYRVRNVSIRSKILTPYITSVLRLRRLKWFGQVNRMVIERLLHQLLFGELEAKRRATAEQTTRAMEGLYKR